MTVSQSQALKFLRLAEGILGTGDYAGRRVAAWIAFAVLRSGGSELDPGTKVRLARVVGQASEPMGVSLITLATKVIDPVLLEVASVGAQVDVGELEELNELRRNLHIYVAEHRVPLHGDT